MLSVYFVVCKKYTLAQCLFIIRESTGETRLDAVAVLLMKMILFAFWFPDSLNNPSKS